MKRLMLLLCVGLATVFPCVVSPGTAGASGLSLYISIQTSEVAFIQFRVTGTNVVGVLHTNTLTVSLADPTTFVPAQGAIASTLYNVTGSDTSRHLILFLNGNSEAFYGTISSGLLSLQLPQSDGSVAILTFEQSTVSYYNFILADWKEFINQNNTVAGQAAAKAQHHQMLLNHLRGAIDSIASDLATMRSPRDLSEHLNQVRDDVSRARDDLSKVERDNRHLSEDGSDNASHAALCGEVLTEYNDAEMVVHNTTAIMNNANSDVSPDLQKDENAMRAAPRDWASYWKAQHALPKFHPKTPVPPLEAAIAEGRGTIARATAHINADIRQANSYIARAYAMPNAAQKAMSCGPTKKVPVIQTLRWR